MGGISGGQLTLSEQNRDDRVRLLECPTCHAPIDQACSDGLTVTGRVKPLASSHMARYLAAVEAELVPQMLGWPPWTG